MSNESVTELGAVEELSMDKFIRTAVDEMFKNDNDTLYMKATLKTNAGSTSELEFKLSIESINGVKTQREDTTNGNS